LQRINNSNAVCIAHSVEHNATKAQKKAHASGAAPKKRNGTTHAANEQGQMQKERGEKVSAAATVKEWRDDVRFVWRVSSTLTPSKTKVPFVVRAEPSAPPRTDLTTPF
jgi:hypothetical protein